MAGSINKVILVGNVGKKPEVRRTVSGDPIVNFSLATTDSWTDKKTNEKIEKTDWHNIVIFNKGLATIAEKYVDKGTKLYIEGSLKTRKWQDKDGHDRYTTEVVLQNFNGQLVLLSRSNENSFSSSYDDYNQDQETSFNQDFSSEIDDEIPF